MKNHISIYGKLLPLFLFLPWAAQGFCPPFNSSEGYTINGILGETRSDHLHNGIDINAYCSLPGLSEIQRNNIEVGWPVWALEGGEVEIRSDRAPWESVVVLQNEAGLQYAYTHINNWYDEHTYITRLQTVGTFLDIYEDFPTYSFYYHNKSSHLHLVRRDNKRYYNVLVSDPDARAPHNESVLDSFSDNKNPRIFRRGGDDSSPIVEPMYFCQNQSSTGEIISEIQLDLNILYGHVGILVASYDNLIGPDSGCVTCHGASQPYLIKNSNNTGYAGLYSYELEIYSNNSSNLIGSVRYLEFSDLPGSGDAFNLSADNNGNTNNRGGGYRKEFIFREDDRFWITNDAIHDDNNPNKFLNTRQRVGCDYNVDSHARNRKVTEQSWSGGKK